MRIEAVDRRGHRAGRCGGERRQRQAFGVARAAPHAQKAARSGEGAPTMTDATLAQFRQSIDNIDASRVFLLAQRFRITKAVGRYKDRKRVVEGKSVTVLVDIGSSRNIQKKNHKTIITTREPLNLAQ